MKNLHILYTDGACSGNPGPGGWGVYWISPEGKESELGGHSNKTTNNAMELTAVIEGLKKLKTHPGAIEVRTDSQYVQKGITEWIDSWEKRGWKTAAKKPVANMELWKELRKLSQERLEGIKWTWVRGHSGEKGNERADWIANKYIRGA